MSSAAPSLENLSPEQRRALLARLLQQKARAPRPHPMSFAQERLWFLDRLQPGLPAYNIPAAFGLSGSVDAGALRRSLTEIVRRHGALRTIFTTEGERPVQVVQPEVSLEMAERDLRALPAEERQRKLRDISRDEARRPFDLARGPLLRATLVRLRDDEALLLVTLHHIVADGWSMGIFQRELSALYTTACAGQPSPLPELPLQYVDFARWQRDWLRGEALERLRSYWRQALAGSPDLLALPTDRPRPAVQTFSGSTLPFRLPPELARSVLVLGQDRGATLFMCLLAALAILLQRYTGQDRINVGSPIAGRTRSELEPLIGLFINTLVLSCDLGGEPGLAAVLDRMREVTLGAYAHQDLPFEKLVEDLQPRRSLNHGALFQVMLALQNDPLAAPAPAAAEGPVDSRALDTGAAKFDLTFFLSGGETGLSGAVEYKVDLFDASTIHRLSRHLEALLAEMAAAPGRSISALSLLTEPERQQLLEWNDTAAAGAAGFLHGMVERQASRTPDAVALVTEAEEITYADLDRRGNAVAGALRRLGTGPEARVGVYLERSQSLVVALLGVLKTGAAFVPLDPSYPHERLSLMLHGSGASAVVTRRGLAGRFPGSGLPEVFADEAAGGEPPPADSRMSTESLAYVLFTSGSTGRPKGVAMPHRGVFNTLRAMRAACPISADDRILLKTPAGFDASVWECFGALSAGARLVVAPPDLHRDAEGLIRTILRHEVTVLQLVPSMLRLLLEQPRFSECRSLRWVVCGGEALSAELRERFAARLGATLINVYGPTEAAINASWMRCERGSLSAAPIGRPLTCVRLHVLDAAGRPTPIGVAGELHIAGEGLARGYLGRPDLTAASFVPDPFAPLPGGRLYKTGDRARLQPDGAAELLGRIGFQIKLRGVRIEPDEVAFNLTGHPGVREAAVVMRQEAAGEGRLAAYFVAAVEPAPETAELRRFLRTRLPEAMIPADFIPLPALPLNPHGKLDRAALPAPDLSRPLSRETLVSPRDAVEDTVRRIWTGLLRIEIEGVGVTESFFDLGGHSLLATQAVSRIRDAFQVEIPLQRFFEQPTIAGLAEAIRELERKTGPRSPAGAIAPRRRPPHPREDLLTLVQARLSRLDELTAEELLRKVEGLSEMEAQASLQSV